MITDHLRRGIRSGRFVPGQHLLESDLTRQLGCSRGSLRPAMIHLAADGIITLSRFKGARISILSRKSICDLLDVLENLVTFTSIKACEHIETGDHRTLVANAIESLKRSSDNNDNGEYLQKRQEFYDALITVSGNEELRRVIPLLRADLLRVQLQLMDADMSRKAHVEGYELIADAVFDKNPKQVEKCVHRHFQRTRDVVAKIPEHAFPESD